MQESPFCRLDFLMDFLEAVEVINLHSNVVSPAAVVFVISFTKTALLFVWCCVHPFFEQGIVCDYFFDC